MITKDDPKCLNEMSNIFYFCNDFHASENGRFELCDCPRKWANLT